MATVICQGMRSCHDTHQIDTRKPLRLKLFSPIKPHIDLSLNKLPCLLDTNTITTEYYSFLQTLSNGDNKQSIMEPTPYVHPSSKSTEKISLELCTESLGSETGCIDIFDNDSTNFFPAREQKKKPFLGDKKAKRSHNFPPPLTSMRGTDTLQMKQHRENGRMVIQAAKIPSRNNCFRAERSNGRLKLWFVKDSASNFDCSSEEICETNINENDGGDGEIDQKAIEEIQRLSRCKESGIENKTGLLNCETYWVVG